MYFVAIWYMYFVAIWHILWPFGIFCGHLAYFVAIWNIFFRFGMLYDEKSGIPGHKGHCEGSL
jgi:hypothetical protein